MYVFISQIKAEAGINSDRVIVLYVITLEEVLKFGFSFFFELV